MILELNQFRDVDLVIDKANDNFIQRQFVSQGDYRGRTLTVQVTDNGLIGQVPGLMLNLRWQNQASGLADLSAFECIDAENSIFRIEYPEHIMTPGKVIANIQVVQNGKVTHLKSFELTVQNLAGEMTGIVGQAEYSALVAVLADANKFRTDIETLGMDKADKVALAETDAEVAELDSSKADKTALANTNQQVSGLASNKVDKGGNEQVTLGMLSQDVKTAMTGGSVAVVGENAINTSNIINRSITTKKLNEEVVDLLTKSVLGGVSWELGGLGWNTGTLSASETLIRTELLKLPKNTEIIFPENTEGWIFFYSPDGTYITSLGKNTGGLVGGYHLLDNDSHVRIMMGYNPSKIITDIEVLSSYCDIKFHKVNFENIGISDLDGEVADALHFKSIQINKWNAGDVSNVDGSDNFYNNKIRIKTGYIKVYPGDEFEIVDSTNSPRFLIRYFDENKNYKGTSSWITQKSIIQTVGYVRLLMEYTDSVNFDSKESLSSKLRFNHFFTVENKNIQDESITTNKFSDETILSSVENELKFKWKKGNFNSGTGEEVSSESIIITENYIRGFKGMEILADYFHTFSQIFIYNIEDKSFIGWEHLGPNRYEFNDDFYFKIKVWNRSYAGVEDLLDLSKTIKVYLNKDKHYIPTYMKDDIMSVNTKLVKQNNRFNFIFFTDPHAYYYHTRGAVEMAKLGQIEHIVHGGDMVRTAVNDVDKTILDVSKHVEELKKSDVDVYPVKGNHEVSDPDANSEVFTNSNWYNSVLKPMKNKNIVENDMDKKGYYYVDNDEYKVRMIFLNLYEDDYGYSIIREQQLKWFAETAMNLSDKTDESSWNIVVFGHSQLLDIYGGSNTPEKTAIAEILKASKLKTPYINETLNINADFTNQSYSLIGYIFGHVHGDIMDKPVGYDYLMCSTTCSQCEDTPAKSYMKSLTRVAGTNTEYAWDVFSIDLENKVLETFRVGAGEDRHINY